MRRVRWIRPALLAAYEYVSSGLTDTPSIEAMLITFAGLAAAPLRSASCSACVRKKGDFRLRSTTLSQPFSGNVSKVSPHAAPALLTRMSRRSLRCVKAAARPRAPSTVDTSAGSEWQGPSDDSSRAAASQASALRDEM